MRAVIGVTDNRWAAFLRDRPQLTEANFWLPSGHAAFKALGVGEPFLFKTHHPDNQLVGGGFYSGSPASPSARPGTCSAKATASSRRPS